MTPWLAVTSAAGEPAQPSTCRTRGGRPLPPDIIVVMVDDLGYIPDDRILERLPAIRETFIEAASASAACTARLRSAAPRGPRFLSGSHTLHHGVTANDGNVFDPSDTLATRLDEAGYHTLLMGKYLNEYEGTRTPPGLGPRDDARGAERRRLQHRRGAVEFTRRHP